MNPETEEKIYFYTEDLQVGYGGKQILNPVRIGIKKGEILTLVGPNGAGKSTILKSVAAQLPPLGGAVYLDGADLLGMKGTERARRMAVMFTEKVHAEWMTCPGCCGSRALSVHGAVWCPLGGGLEGS